MVEESKSSCMLSAICPVCKQKVDFQCENNIVTQAKCFPVACSFKHCGRVVLVYIDANFKVRGTESAIDISSASSIPKEEFEAVPVAAFASPSIERRTIYACASESESMVAGQIPNIIEKQLIHHIYEHRRISLASLAELVKGLESAMNITLDFAMIKRFLEKYVAKGIISERIIEAG